MATRKTKSKPTTKTKEAEMPMPSSSMQVKKRSRLRSPKVLIPLLIIILLIGAYFLKGLFIVATVNGQPISRLTLIHELEKQGGKQTLDALINESLILQEAKKKNVDVSQQELDDAAKQVEDSLKSQGQDLNTALATQGMTRQDFLTQLKIRKLVEKLLANDIKVSDKEVDDYVANNKDTLPTNLSEDELKKGVRQQLEQQKLATKSQEWIDNLNKNAKINYFVNY